MEEKNIENNFPELSAKGIAGIRVELEENSKHQY